MNGSTKFQQQILFDEQDVEVATNKELSSQQMIVENDDWQPLIDEQDELLATTEQDKPIGIVWTLFLVALLAVIGIELVDFFITGIVESPMTTSLYGVVLFCIALLSGSSLYRELVGLAQLKKRNSLREDINQSLAGERDVDAAVICEAITKSLPCDLSTEQLSTWQKTLGQDFTSEELFALYSRQILKDTDQKALAEVARFSSESVVLVALSPVALLDMLIMLWRNLTLVDKIAGLYGLKLGYWSRIKLVKQVITNMLYAGASEVVADVSADMLGADMLGKLSGRLAQGLGAGMLTARLGLKTIYLCRPMPFDEQAPKLSQVRQEVVSQLKKLL